MRFVICIVHERQLRLYGHVARFPDTDPTHQILSARESREWRRPMGRPRASWLQQVDRNLKEMGMGRHLPGGWPDGGPWSTGGKWMQRRAALAHAPIPELTFLCGAYISTCACFMDFVQISLIYYHLFIYLFSLLRHTPKPQEGVTWPF